MDFQVIAWIVGTGITILGLLLVIVQYHNKQLVQFYSEKYEGLKKNIDKLEQELKQTRDEMADKYVRITLFDNVMTQFHGDINKIFDSVNNLSSDVNQLIGEIKGSKKNGT